MCPSLGLFLNWWEPTSPTYFWRVAYIYLMRIALGHIKFQPPFPVWDNSAAHLSFTTPQGIGWSLCYDHITDKFLPLHINRSWTFVFFVAPHILVLTFLPNILSAWKLQLLSLFPGKTLSHKKVLSCLAFPWYIVCLPAFLPLWLKYRIRTTWRKKDWVWTHGLSLWLANFIALALQWTWISMQKEVRGERCSAQGDWEAQKEQGVRYQI